MTVPSSTFNFEVVKDQRWGRRLGTSFAAALVVLLAWEIFVRGHGFQPSLKETADNWAIARDHVGKDTLVIVGSSRAQAAIDPDLLAHELRLPHALQLSWLGGNPIAVLEELAADSSYHGVVLVAIDPPIVFAKSADTKTLTEYYDRRKFLHTSPSAYAEAHLRALVQSKLALLRAELAPALLFEHWLAGSALPPAPHHHMRRDRFRPVYPDIDKPWVPSEQPALNDAEMSVLLERMRRATEALRARGGKVIYLHLPFSKRLRAQEQTAFPRERYWDRMVREGDAPVIDGDLDFDCRCRDGSHLDADEAPAFTRALAKKLAAEVR
jgi:hypothetical protein